MSVQPVTDLVNDDYDEVEAGEEFTKPEPRDRTVGPFNLDLRDLLTLQRIALGDTDEAIGSMFIRKQWSRGTDWVTVGKDATRRVRRKLGAVDRASCVALGFKYGHLTWVNGELISRHG